MKLIRATTRDVKTAAGMQLQRTLRTLSLEAALASVCFSLTLAQTSIGEAELRKAHEFRAQNQYDSSIVHYKIGKSIFESSSRRDLYYRCIAGITDNLLRKTEFGPADSVLSGAIHGVRTELGDQHKGTAEIYSLAGYLRTYQDRFGEARDYYERSLAIREGIYGRNDPQVAAIHFGLGLLFKRSGEFDAALNCLSKARAIQEAMRDSGLVDLANTLATIGSVYDLRSEPSKAIDAFSQASSILADAGLGNSPSSAYCFHFLAICYRNLGQSEKAVAYERKTLEIYKRTYGERHLAVAASLAQLGDHLAANGDFAIALQCYEESSSIITALLGSDHSSAHEVERKRAGLYAMRNELQRALTIYLRVASRHSRDFGSRNPELGALYHEIAEVYRKLGAPRKALRFYSRALTLRREIRSSTARLDIASLLHDEGRARIALGEYKRAAAVLRQSLVLQDSARADNLPLRSSTYESLAEICRKRGDILGSVRLYQQALIALCPDFRDTSVSMNPEVPHTPYCRDYVRLLAGKATALLHRRGKSEPTLASLQAALAAYTRASDALKRLRNSYRSEGSKLILQEERSSVYNAGMAVAARIAQKTGDPGAKEAAFSFSEQSKALILLEAIQNSKARHFAGVPDRLLNDERHLQRELAALLNKAEWIQRRPDSSSSSALRKAILEKNWTIARLEDSLAILSPEFHTMYYGTRAASFREVQRVLDSETCLIEYSIGPASLYAFIIRNGSFDLVTMDRPRNLDTLAKNLRHALRTMNDRGYLETAGALYREIFQPIERSIAGARRLVIVPDGPLYYLPFEVLISADPRPASGNTARIDFRQLRYLVNRFEISYALSGMLFCDAQSATVVKRGAPLSFVGFAPVSEESHGDATRSSMNEGSKGRESGIVVPALDRSRFSGLPHSESEVRGIAEDFNAAGRNGTYVAGPGATKADFTAHAARYSIVHIATHCFIDEDNPGASTLLFAPGQESSSGGDALLYAGETYNLRLNADLVTLSSCESGVGKLVRGEGLMAMTRGFFYAGAKNVVCSLWKVYDNHADQLMRGFYRHILEGREFSSALREAKLAMIRNRVTAHPFKWAGFTLIGQ